MIQCSSEMQEAPVAKKIKKVLEIHDDQRIDNYFWMRLSDEQKEAEQPDQQTQDVLDYLHAENDYRKYVMKPTEKLQKTIYDEIFGRIKQDDSSVPITVNGYNYYTRFEKGDFVIWGNISHLSESAGCEYSLISDLSQWSTQPTQYLRNYFAAGKGRGLCLAW